MSDPTKEPPITPGLVKLRDIILAEDRANYELIKRTIEDPEHIEVVVKPLIKAQLDELKANFPTEFAGVIAETIEYQIKNSQSSMVDAMYPITGKLVKKYVHSELAKLNEAIDKKMRKTFSFGEQFNRLKNRSRGLSEADLIINEGNQAKIKEVFLIERDSGLLRAHYSLEEDSDADLVAGMLTAIKQFAEDVYSNTSQDLSSIDYDTFTLQLHEIGSYYIATAVTGYINFTFKDKLNDRVMEFTEDVLSLNSEDTGFLNRKLRQYFDIPIDSIS